jgi:glucose-1-phosphate thymidylyltransferase
MKGLLLAGGHGTRLRPLTFTGNKHMLPIANKPMLLYGLEHLKNAGIKEIGIILGPIKEGVEETLGDGSKFGVNITYIDQPEPKGLAHAVMVAEEFLRGEPFAMYLGDNLIKQGITPLVKLFEENGSDCVVAATQVKNPGQYGVVVFDKNGKIERFVEKPKEYISDWALVGLYIFNDKVFDAVKRIKPSWRGELEITDTIQTLLKDGARVDVQRVQGWWKDTGTVEDLLEANRLVLDDLNRDIKGVVEEGPSIRGRVSVGLHTKIMNGATVVGPSVIGSDTTLGEGVYIGPYTSLGNKVTVRRGEIENSILMDGCIIDTEERIVNSLIGPYSLVTSNSEGRPRGKRLILGERSRVEF